jgi:hypothetical protein
VKAITTPLDPKASPLPARIAARVESGGIDSWCFAVLHFPGTADLSRYQALEFLTRVDSGMTASGAKLTAIIHEDGEGGPTRDYIADARRPLDEPGLRSSVIPFDSFQLAGWSRDPDGKLDLARIRDICIGWGGHIGREGEEVVFDLEGINFLGLPARGGNR